MKGRGFYLGVFEMSASEYSESEDKLLQSAIRELTTLQSDLEHPRLIDGRLDELVLTHERLLLEVDKVTKAHKTLIEYKETLPEKIEAAKQRIAELKATAQNRIESAKTSRLSTELETLLAKIAGSGVSIDTLIGCLQAQKEATPTE